VRRNLTFNFVTIAIWGSAETIEAARKAVMARHEEMGLNPQDMLARLGIKADLASYLTDLLWGTCPVHIQLTVRTDAQWD
jgi:hypothetical protein